jgi:integrase
VARTKSRANGDGDVWARKNREGRIYGYRGSHVGPDGRRRYVSSENKEDARRKLRAARADSDRGLLFDTADLRLGDYLDSWLTDSVMDTVRQRTYERYESIVRVHIKPALGRVKLDALTPNHVRRLYRQNLDSGLAPRTVNYIHVTLHKVLKDAVSDALIPRNAASVRAPRPEKPEIHPLSPDQARKLIATARETEDRFEALYVLALHCGLRKGELLGLKWDDIDPSGSTATLHVKRTLSQTRTGHIFEKPKNGKGRSIKCSQKATQALGRHRSRQNQERRAAGPLWQDNDIVFPTLTGTTKSGTNLLGRHFKPLLKRAKLPPIRVHDLRHTCATILLMTGKHPKYVQELLGHASINITLDTYSHVIEGMDGGLADAMDDAL